MYFSRDNDDPEKISKMDDGSAQSAPPTMPHMPMTTPPPNMMGGDMSGSYGGYGSWYQVQENHKIAHIFYSKL